MKCGKIYEKIKIFNLNFRRHSAEYAYSAL